MEEEGIFIAKSEKDELVAIIYPKKGYGLRDTGDAWVIMKRKDMKQTSEEVEADMKPSCNEC